jgi:hypothetical protein
MLPNRAEFIPDSKRDGSAATGRGEAAASLTIEAIRAAGTPCPEKRLILDRRQRMPHPRKGKERHDETRLSTSPALILRSGHVHARDTNPNLFFTSKLMACDAEFTESGEMAS